MADDIRFDVSGLAGVRERMKGLKAEVNFRAGRTALRAASQVLRDQARENARKLDDPTTPEEIWKNIDIRWNSRAFKRDGVLPFRLGVLGGARKYSETVLNVRRRRVGQTYRTLGSAANPGGDTWYWRFLEFGTEQTAARPFLRPVASQAGQKAIDVFATKLSEGIDRALAKQAQGAQK